eukprot:scaffold16747_cov86-Isochrysis_galbana.AAC.4
MVRPLHRRRRRTSPGRDSREQSRPPAVALPGPPHCRAWPGASGLANRHPPRELQSGRGFTTPEMSGPSAPDPQRRSSINDRYHRAIEPASHTAPTYPHRPRWTQHAALTNTHTRDTPTD